MRFTIKLSLPIIALFVLSSCQVPFPLSSSETSSSIQSSSISESIVSTSLTPSSIVSSVDPVMEEAIGYPMFFSEDTRLQTSISITRTNLRSMNQWGEEKQNRYNDFYVPMTLTIVMNEHTFVFEEVGVRLKGNIYSRGSFLDDSTIIRPFHLRLKFDYHWDDPKYQEFGLFKPWTAVDPFHQARNDRRLFGMRSLEMKWNRSEDPSMVNQVFASRLFQTHGVIAPKVTLSELIVNTTTNRFNMGVYTLYEPVDEIMIKRYFQGTAGEGDLYKALYPVDLVYDSMVEFSDALVKTVFKSNIVGVEDTWNGYFPVYDLKTNRRRSNHEALFNLVSVLKIAGTLPFDEQRMMLSTVVDIPSFLNYLSVSYLIGHPDDMRNNRNNTYIYFHGTTQKAYFIPYDFDWSLGITWDPSLTIATGSRSPFSGQSSFETIANPLLWYTVITDNNEPFRQRYPLMVETQQQYKQLILDQFAHQSFTVASYRALFDAYATMYHNVNPSLYTATHFNHIDAFNYHRSLISQTVNALRE
jgi:spore coat protein CotH